MAYAIAQFEAPVRLCLGFSRAHIELKQAGDRQRRVAVLADLGKDSLMESYLWTIHRFHREHEPPAAG